MVLKLISSKRVEHNFIYFIKRCVTLYQCGASYFWGMSEKSLKLMKAMEIMRAWSQDKRPFSISYCSLNESSKSSEGKKTEKNILLASGYRRNQSDKHDILVSFIRTDTMERRQFYLPLLLEFNGIKIKI